MKTVDLTGMVFGRLTVTSRSERLRGGKVYWNCECICGAKREVYGYALKSGCTKSCGCLNREICSAKMAARNKSHGCFGHELYDVWAQMVRRCTNPRSKDYKDYGGRGITVCQDWLDVRSFIRDMHPRPTGTVLDRIDNNAGYSAANCRWATTEQSANNTRRSKLYTFKGEVLSLAQVARKCGLNYWTLVGRVCKRKQPLAEALHQLGVVA